VEGVGLNATPSLLDDFAGKSAFVTGHTGFKGSWLALFLHSLGAKVHGYSLAPPTEPSNFEASRVAELCASHRIGDVRDANSLERALRAAKPDFVFHLAAQPLVRDSYSMPADTFETNVMGTVRLLDAVRTIGSPCTVVVVTSDKCYQNVEQLWGYREIDPLGGSDPYSASKGATELVVASYRQSFFPADSVETHGIRLASARAGNVIGGGDWARDRIICDLVRALSAGQPAPVRNPNAIRPWQHVLEPLGGYVRLAQRMATSNDPRFMSGWNFGPLASDVLPVSELTDLFLRVWGEGHWVHQPSPRAPHEAAILRLSIDKAVSLLGWKPCFSVAQAIEKTANWYRAFYQARHDMRTICFADIREYLQLVGEVPQGKNAV
jgi:CDP-glucose 4,6-dehydratase